MSSAFWNERYAGEGLAYGAAPNEFLAQMAGRLPRTGNAIDIGAGEGRNALFLASLGLDVLAVDQSIIGMQKARRLAGQRGLKLRTRAIDLRDFSVDLERSIALRPRLPAGALAVAESGIASRADVERLAAAGFDAFLIGESLLLSGDPQGKLRELFP